MIINRGTATLAVLVFVGFMLKWIWMKVQGIADGSWFANYYPFWHIAMVCLVAFEKLMEEKYVDSPTGQKGVRGVWAGITGYFVTMTLFGSETVAGIAGIVVMLLVWWKPNWVNRSFSFVFMTMLPLTMYSNILSGTDVGWEIVIPFLLSFVLMKWCKNDSRIEPRYSHFNLEEYEKQQYGVEEPAPNKSNIDL